MALTPCVPLYDKGDTITGLALGALVGCRFVGISGPMQANMVGLNYPVAGGRAVGVVSLDVPAGEDVMIICGSQTVPVLAGAPITAGSPVATDGSGQAVPATGTATVLGTAFSDAAAGGFVFVKLQNV